MNLRDQLVRARWSAVGAAVAVSLGCFAIARAEPPAGQANVFVPIVPCRLLDTRPAPDNVGARNSPIQADESFVQQVTGAVGQCDVPTDATAVAMNVTAVGGTEASFLTLHPADAALPLASNLNWQPGDGPDPNKVDVKLSPTGAIRIYNKRGTVDVVGDVVGYYTDHNQTLATQVVTATGSIAAGGFGAGSQSANCPTGTVVTGGGVGSGSTEMRVYSSFPLGNGWFGVVKYYDNLTRGTAFSFTVYAVCAHI